jgi:two-component system response regulator
MMALDAMTVARGRPPPAKVPRSPSRSLEDPMDDVEILLVEDNPKDIELTLHALGKTTLAARVHVARDGQAALEYLFGTADGPAPRPRLVLLDLKLPRVSGLEVLRRLKADPRTRAIPVVVMTASTVEKDMVKSYGLGVDGYLRKPVDFREFVIATKTVGLHGA